MSTTSPDATSRPGSFRSLTDADWLNDDRLQRVMMAIAGSDEEIRVVGGAVRNALMGYRVADIDLATTATPKIVTARALLHGMKPVPTGIDHGTVTVVADGKPFEVTTLRQDVTTDGRHAVVEFGRDWASDARRRDFTVNALYATASGEIIDLVGGIADCSARRIRFIGDPQARIHEDYLRILRLFRFHATFSDGPIDPDGLAAAVHLREGVLSLSAERIGQEILKLLTAAHAPDVLRIMHTNGILPLALGTDAVDLDRFARLHRTIATLAETAGAEAVAQPATLLLAALAGDGAPGSGHLARRLRLSNAMRDRMVAAWVWQASVTPDFDDRKAHALIFRARRDTYRDAVLLSASASNPDWSTARIADLLHLATRFVPPSLPISGRDLLALGIDPGPDLGATLDRLRERWIASDFTVSKAELLADIRAAD